MRRCWCGVSLNAVSRLYRCLAPRFPLTTLTNNRPGLYLSAYNSSASSSTLTQIASAVVGRRLQLPGCQSHAGTLARANGDAEEEEEGEETSRSRKGHWQRRGERDDEEGETGHGEGRGMLLQLFFFFFLHPYREQNEHHFYFSGSNCYFSCCCWFVK